LEYLICVLQVFVVRNIIYEVCVDILLLDKLILYWRTTPIGGVCLKFRFVAGDGGNGGTVSGGINEITQSRRASPS